MTINDDLLDNPSNGYDKGPTDCAFQRQGGGVVCEVGRVAHYEYGTSGLVNDRLSRIKSIHETNGSRTAWASYAYSGESRLATVDYPNTVRLDYHQGTARTYAGYDRFGRIKDQRWDDTDATADADRYQYGYDKAGNCLFRDNRGHRLVNATLSSFAFLVTLLGLDVWLNQRELAMGKGPGRSIEPERQWRRLIEDQFQSLFRYLLGRLIML